MVFTTCNYIFTIYYLKVVSISYLFPTFFVLPFEVDKNKGKGIKQKLTI
jgi:hypothetical protein